MTRIIEQGDPNSGRDNVPKSVARLNGHGLRCVRQGRYFDPRGISFLFLAFFFFWKIYAVETNLSVRCSQRPHTEYKLFKYIFWKLKNLVFGTGLIFLPLFATRVLKLLWSQYMTFDYRLRVCGLRISKNLSHSLSNISNYIKRSGNSCTLILNI